MRNIFPLLTVIVCILTVGLFVRTITLKGNGNEH